mmetsp:Transcript_28694/g.63701  ORF Transcript_28694/g.63701 Transcript_28694/m.63701 type:complete len:232 (-) Transcript_28694:438-1133(-)
MSPAGPGTGPFLRPADGSDVRFGASRLSQWRPVLQPVYVHCQRGCGIVSTDDNHHHNRGNLHNTPAVQTSAGGGGASGRAGHCSLLSAGGAGAYLAGHGCERLCSQDGREDHTSHACGGGGLHVPPGCISRKPVRPRAQGRRLRSSDGHPFAPPGLRPGRLLDIAFVQIHRNAVQNGGNRNRHEELSFWVFIGEVALQAVRGEAAARRVCYLDDADGRHVERYLAVYSDGR